MELTRLARGFSVVTATLLALAGGGCGGEAPGAEQDTASLVDTAEAAGDARDGASGDGDALDVVDAVEDADADTDDAADTEDSDATDPGAEEIADGADSDDTDGEDVADGADVADTVDTAEPPLCPGGDGAVIGPAGGVATFAGATLTVPAGALADDTTICVTLGGDPPAGYTAYSPVYAFAPDGLVFAAPATLDVALTTTPPDAVALFLSRATGPAYQWVGASIADGHVTGPVSHFSTAFAGDGTDYVDPPDPTCARTRLLEGRTIAPSGVALFVTVDDCHGTPLTALGPAAFVIDEDGAPLTSESAVSVLANDGVAVFVTLVLDMSSSTASRLPDLVAAARAFVDRVMVDEALPVRVSIELFSGPEQSVVWQGFQRDAATVLGRLADLTGYVSPDPASTNLRGAVAQALAHSDAAQAAFRAENAGGAFTIGHLVLFTDGRDTASWLTEEDAVAAVTATTNELVAVGLQTPDYDEAALAALAPGGVFTAQDGPGLETAFSALANRIARQVARTYLIGYCSPKKLGDHVASVRVAGADTTEAAAFTFTATGFGPGCTAELFSDSCAGRECGGLGCGACDEREDACDAAAGACVSYCSTVCEAPGDLENPHGYVQDCGAECDRDWVEGDADNCRFTDNPGQDDRDGDALGDACDEDVDGDGVVDTADGCVAELVGWTSDAATDHDGDGCRDEDQDGDDDGDGVEDARDRCARGEMGWVSGFAVDHDHDGCRDATEDDDDDDDGFLDVDDGCPLGFAGGAPAIYDLDQDGCIDALEDDDDDGDGVLDDVDPCFPSPVPAADHDGDGCGDTEDDDNDDDGVPNGADACPLGLVGPGEDYDGDGCQDAESADDDGDGVRDEDDACPRGETGWSAGAATDIDGDGCRDAGEDDDDDGDGILDGDDRCPTAGTTPEEDYDGDGCANAVDGDDDDDGVADGDDACALGAVGVGPDLDRDGCHDDEDDDDDGDGVADADDPCPRAPFLVAFDQDHDGCPDIDVANVDGDALFDSDDACVGDAPCLCRPTETGLCLRRLATLSGEPFFGPSKDVYGARTDELGIWLDRYDVAGGTVDSVLVHAAEERVIPGYSDVTEDFARVNALLGLAGHDLIVQGGSAWHGTPIDTTQMDLWDYVTWLVGIGPDGARTFSLELRDSVLLIACDATTCTYVSDDSVYDEWPRVQSVVRVALADGAELWRHPGLVDEDGLSFALGRLLRTRLGKYFVIGALLDPASGYAYAGTAVGEIGETGDLLWSTRLEPECGAACGDSIATVEESARGGLLVSTTSDLSIEVDAVTHQVVSTPRVAGSDCEAGAEAWFADEACQVMPRTEVGPEGSRRIRANICDGDGLVASAGYAFGAEQLTVSALVTVPGGARLAAVDGTHGRYALLSLEPCAAAPGVCDDVDACTADASTAEGGCESTFVPSAECGACRSNQACADDNPCTADRCVPWGDGAGCKNTPGVCH